ncbi:glucosamine-phosphate N-acetyltransferase, partial [Tremellales sp. Uapishka_1]
MTPDSSLELLFDPSIIPSSVQAQLGPDFHLRPLSSTDNQRGHLELLTILTAAPSLTIEAYQTTFNELKSRSNTYFTIVIVHSATDRIVAAGTILVERKFIRNSGLVGHIEDIAVSKSQQGKKLGLRIINALEEIGRERGCYKIILDCSKDNIPFYERCGFHHKEYEMVLYMTDPPVASKASGTSRL